MKRKGKSSISAGQKGILLIYEQKVAKINFAVPHQEIRNDHMGLNTSLNTSKSHVFSI